MYGKANWLYFGCERHFFNSRKNCGETRITKMKEVEKFSLYLSCSCLRNKVSASNRYMVGKLLELKITC